MTAPTRYLCWTFLFFTIVLYRRLLWRTGDIVKNIPITLYHRSIPAERDGFFKKTPIFYLLPSVSRWRTWCIDHQQQQSVASAILSTKQQNVLNSTINTLIITTSLKSASTLCLWGQIYMELAWDICYAVLKKWNVNLGPIYTKRLFGAAMKKTDKTFFSVLRFLSATPFVVFVFSLFCGIWPFSCVFSQLVRC